ncbi:MAG TPA: toll/interleukin-1 receptor domain-containing protein [Longimicrobiaceae bacterium]|nr:toll/interleukin-1 receptor domain-containing protein [Longimicrobiaceae bacterium]
MIAEHKRFVEIESELRQNLLRGYRRVRQEQAQGVKLEGAECVLELLGDPQLLVFVHSATGWKIEIPLVVVLDWKLRRKDDVARELHGATATRDLVSPYKRRCQAEPHGSDIHSTLVGALREYIRGFPEKKLLLDWLWAPRPEERDHDEIRSENWFAYSQAQGSPNVVFSDYADQLPERMQSVDGLVRLTFPLCDPGNNQPYLMTTIILGLNFESLNKPRELLRREEDISRMMGLVGHLGTVLITEIPELYRKVRAREPGPPTFVTPPAWVGDEERDSLRTAVDDLHRRINELAARVKVGGWGQPENGYNFLIAFRELNERFEPSLRYCLSLSNLHALGSQYRDTDAWKAALVEAVTRCEPALVKLYARTRGAQSTAAADARELVHEVYAEINRLFDGTQDLDLVRQRVRSAVEGSPYPLWRTPGYWVMDLSHPEIISGWLNDPRATNFYSYPRALLAWELTAVPQDLYFSPVADGAVPVGVCGVNAALLDNHACSAYELQEIIDESASRFRRILSGDELDRLKREVKDQRRKLARGTVDAAGFWAPILRRFRRLAYYYLPRSSDFFPKLVPREAIPAFFFREGKWRQRRERWREVRGLTEHQLQFLAQECAEGQDFLKSYLERRRQSNPLTREEMQAAHLHEIVLPDAPSLSLFLLIPSAVHSALAQELIHRFLNRCERGFEEPPPEGDAARLPRVFVSYRSSEKSVARDVARALEGKGLQVWYDRESLEPGAWVIPEIERALEEADCLVVLVAPGALGSFQDVEVQAGLDRFRQGKGLLVPVLIEGAKPEDMPGLLLRQVQSVQFTAPDAVDRIAKRLKSYLKERRAPA